MPAPVPPLRGRRALCSMFFWGSMAQGFSVTSIGPRTMHAAAHITGLVTERRRESNTASRANRVLFPERNSPHLLQMAPLQAGWAKLAELRRHIQAFKASGKFTVAWMSQVGLPLQFCTLVPFFLIPRQRSGKRMGTCSENPTPASTCTPDGGRSAAGLRVERPSVAVTPRATAVSKIVQQG